MACSSTGKYNMILDVLWSQKLKQCSKKKKNQPINKQTHNEGSVSKTNKQTKKMQKATERTPNG